MNRFLTGCLIFISAACQSLTPTPLPELPLSTATRPPIPSATVSPTFPPTSTPSPTAIPLFFTEEFDSGLAAWSSFQTSGDLIPQAATQNGSLAVIFTSPHTWYYAIHSTHEYRRVRIDSRFSSTGDGIVSTGLVCMYTESKGWYEYNFLSDGTYNLLLGQWVAPGIAQYRPIVHDTSEYLTPGRNDYEIGLACEKEYIWLYIDGKLFRKLDVSHHGLEGGKVGIAAAVFEQVPITTFFEWFQLSEAPE